MLVTPGLARLRGRLLIQAASVDLRHLVPVVAASQGGLVLGGAEGIDLLPDLRDDHPRVPVLIDRERYRGCGRLPASAPFDLAWLEEQHLLGVTAVLTDSGYIGPADLAGLRSVLTQTRTLGDTVGDLIALLPLHHSWLSPQWTRELVREINDARVPVALVLEHRADPFAAQTRIRCLLRLFAAATVPVLLLRSGVSALGALAGGAFAAAIGITGSHRQLAPDPEPDAAQFEDSVLVAPLLTFHGLPGVEQAARLLGDLLLWSCACTVCRGNSVERLYYATGVERAVHTIECVLEGARRLADGGDRSGLHRWHLWCGSAAEYYDGINRAVNAAVLPAELKPPAALVAWRRVTAEFLPTGG